MFGDHQDLHCLTPSFPTRRSSDLNEASSYVVDDLEQYASVGARHWHGFRDPDGELAGVVEGTLAVPEHGRRMFLNMGIAMDDVALGALCYDRAIRGRSEEHTSELQSLMRISYAVFCLKKKQ